MGRSRGKRKKPARVTLNEGAESLESSEKPRKTSPTRITDRLTFPLLQPPAEESSCEDSDEDETVELRFSARLVFAVNLCLVCMERSRLVCEHCRMVSYCSTNHRAEGWPRHRDLCGALREIRSIEDSAGDRSKELSPQDYRVYRTKLLEILQTEIRRPLELWEREVILYPRICRLCRDTSERLLCCEDCSMEFFCKEHRAEHRRWCNEFRVFRRCLFLQHRNREPVNPRIPDIPMELQDASVFATEDFDGLMYRVYQSSEYYRSMDCLSYGTLSHISTIPLTSLYAAQLSHPDLPDRSDFRIHVIGAEFQFEGINLHVWEKLFLHFLPRLKRLSVALVGPELRLPDGVPPELLSRVSLCPACKSAGRTVTVSFHPGKCYHEAGARGCQLPEPDLVSLFNPGLYRETGFDGRDTWPETVREFCKTRAPVLVTSYTEHEIPREIIRISSIAPFEILLPPKRNPFSSIKPDRNFVSDDAAPLIYKNYYLTVVRGK